MSLIVKFAKDENTLACSFFLFTDYYIVLGPLVSFFSKEEVAWILAHELGHVEDSLHCCPYLDKNSPQRVCRDFFLLTVLLSLACVMSSTTLLSLLGLLFYYIIHRWQRREYRADKFASLVMGVEVGIRTLQKLQSIDGHGLSLTHPSYQSRIDNLPR
jgi:Zn-dependent protease with chaperone function